MLAHDWPRIMQVNIEKGDWGRLQVLNLQAETSQHPGKVEHLIHVWVATT